MKTTVYRRIDVKRLSAAPADTAPRAAGRPTGKLPGAAVGVRWFVLPLSVVLCILQAVVTIYASNAQSIQVTSTLIAVLAMGALFVAVLFFNPLLRLVYLGNVLSAGAALRCESAMGWAGRATVALALTYPAAFGPRVMLAGWAILAAVAAAVFLADLGAGLASRRAGALSTVGRGALTSVLTLLVAMAVLQLARLAGQGGASLHLPLAGVALPPGALLLLLVAGAYVALWVLFSRGLNRAELMTLAAALIVSSGISTFGLCEQIVPLIPAPFNPQWNTPQSGWGEQLTPSLQSKLYITDAGEIRTFRARLTQTNEPTPRPIAQPDEKTASAGEWISYYWTVAVNIRWGYWLSPLAYWMVFILGIFALFYSLTYTVLGHWSGREKIIFPLAKLPESLLPEARNPGWFPPIFHSRGFWIGLLVSCLVLSYNGAVRAGFLGGGMGLVPLGMGANAFTAYVQGTPFEGLGGGGRAMHFSIIFTAIGIAFLLPLEISLSIWFYYLAGRAILLVMVWTGHGRDMRDFPDDWLWSQTAVTAIGGGALVVFSVIMLYRTIKDSVTHVFKTIRGWRGRAQALTPILGLAASVLVVSGWIWWNLHWEGRYMIWALVFVLFLTLLTLGIMRTTAEGGVYWYQVYGGSFFHFWKALGLGAWFPGAVIGPLLPIYSVLFLDLKTFIAPNMANAGKMEEDLPRAGRVKFHLNMALTMIVSIASSIGFAIVMAYARGAQRMQNWFYTSGPRSTMDTAFTATSSVPQFDRNAASWIGMGAAWVVVTVFLRRTLFWFPHPIGLVMLINPLMDQMWFSFFVGWVCKKLVVQYGGKSTFDKFKDFFIGLILGEILTICAWTVISLIIAIPPTYISLNRAD